MDDSIAVESQAPSIKVGDKVYTPEEIQKLETNRDYFQTESQKAKEQLKTLEATASKADDVLSGKAPASSLTEAEVEDLKYFKKIGGITKEELEEVVKKVKEETTKEVEEKLTAKERKEKLQSELNAIVGKYSFAKEQEIIDYMTEEAKKGIVLDPEKATKLLYFDKIQANGIKPDELPSMEGSKGRIEEPKPKEMELGGRELNEYMRSKVYKQE